ncbi:MAG: hypothetical protein FJ109_05500 [Deltaproteobacteria bacterium]|nr:hypothetical protein [Deltaproteobacteria bacterium]
MRLGTVVLVVIGVVLLGLTACGGGGGGGGTTVNLGDDGKVASTMTEAEAENACKAVSAQMWRSEGNAGGKHVTCLAVGSFAKAAANDDVKACQDAYDACMAKPDEESGDDCGDAFDDLTDCKATLGEIEDCMNDQVAAIEEAFAEAKKVNCSSTEEEFKVLGDLFETDEEPTAACKLVEEKCPSMVEDDEQTEPAPPME